MKTINILAFVAILFTLIACDDTTDSIGTSVTDNLSTITIKADTFNVTSRSVLSNSVVNRNNIGYLGYIRDPETGSLVRGNFLTLFHTLENYSLPEFSKIVSKEEGRVVADSCEIRLYYRNFYGDSLATMKLTAKELSHPVEEGQIYYSDFDPEKEGFIRQDGIQKQQTYSLVDLKIGESDRNQSTYINRISIPLSDKYIDKQGKSYKNYGSYMMEKYFENPKYFKNSYEFSHNVVPGFFFKHTGGIGSMAYITSSALNVYFRYIDGDSTYNAVMTFAGTEEVLQTTQITNDNDNLQSLVSDNSCTYLKTPAGIYTEMILPIDEIVYGHENDTINSAKLVIPRIKNENTSNYTLPYPKTLLILPIDSISSFFEKETLPDNKLYFLANYTTSKSENVTTAINAYTFNNIGTLVSFLAKNKKEGLRTDNNWLTKNPNWNKVAIIPVEVTTVLNQETNKEEITKVTNNMSLTSTRLVGGLNSKYGNLQITVVYSNFQSK